LLELEEEDSLNEDSLELLEELLLLSEEEEDEDSL
jgi:hypothetical protein